MYTFAPLPEWSDLIKGFSSLTRRHRASAAPWVKDHEIAHWFSSGTQILFHTVRDLAVEQGGEPPTVWFPDYFCDAATRLIRDHDIAVIFYPVNDQLNPDWEACQTLAETGPPPDVFILVHYFGRAGEVCRAAEFCRDRQAFLIEDAAHVLFAYGPIGAFGDAIFYCPHKVLPTPDGALVTRAGGASRLRPGPRASRPSTLAWLIKRIFQKLLPGALLRYRIRRLGGFAIAPSASSAPPPAHSLGHSQGHSQGRAPEPGALGPSALGPSALGQAMIDVYADQLTAIAEARKRAAKQWRDAFQPYGEVGRALLSIEEEGPAPYRFILKCHTHDLAWRSFNAFRQAGIGVDTWPDLAPEVHAAPLRHATAFELRNTLLFFPVFNALPKGLRDIVDKCIRASLNA